MLASSLALFNSIFDSIILIASSEISLAIISIGNGHCLHSSEYLIDRNPLAESASKIQTRSLTKIFEDVDDFQSSFFKYV
ncbi:hypothetical protein DERF_010674 [Dermatophagoides farinae]|uniref:Uncharacterized protein n=1 Tax=Dermatophagoides farinae TaxID=6954 RepID=A0A922HQR4_DERFA|nr:hypothetical protein DERF_010674 [Dermatophagoides farinae]